MKMPGGRGNPPIPREGMLIRTRSAIVMGSSSHCKKLAKSLGEICEELIEAKTKRIGRKKAAQIASGYLHHCDPVTLVDAPAGLAYDP